MTIPKFAIVMIGALALAGVTPGQAEEAKPADKKPPAATQAAPGIKREILQKFDVPGTNYETVIMRVSFDANMDIPRHTHPGPEGSYVLQGDVTYMIDGQGPEVRTAGGSITLPGNAIHAAKVGPNGVVLLGSYILEKGKPFMTKVEAPAEPPKP